MSEFQIGDIFSRTFKRKPEYFRVVNIHTDGCITAVSLDDHREYPHEWPDLHIFPIQGQNLLTKENNNDKKSKNQNNR